MVLLMEMLVTAIVVFAALVHGRALSTGFSSFSSSKPRVVMIFVNRTVSDGETVTVLASQYETRKEVPVACVATNAPANAVLACPYHAQNANLLDVYANSQCPDAGRAAEDDDGSALVTCKRLALEAGGFLKLRCVLTQPNSTTGPLAYTEANFTLQQSSETTTQVAVSKTTPLSSSSSLDGSDHVHPDHQASPMSKNAQLNSGSRSIQSVPLLCTILVLLLSFRLGGDIDHLMPN